MGTKKTFLKRVTSLAVVLVLAITLFAQLTTGRAQAATASVAKQADIWSLLQFYKPGGNCSFTTPIGVEELTSGGFINGTGTNQKVGWQTVSGGEGKLCTKMLEYLSGAGYTSANYDQLLLKLGYTQGTYPGGEVKFSTPHSMNTDDQMAYTTKPLEKLLSDQYFGGADISGSPSKAVLYYIYHTNFVLGCQATQVGLYSDKTSQQALIWTENSHGDKDTGPGKAYTIWDLDDDKVPQLYMYEGQKNSGDNVNIGPAGSTADDDNYEENCSEVAEWMQGGSGKVYAEAYAAAITAGLADPLATNPIAAGTTANTDIDGCFSITHPTTWLVCPLLSLASDFVQKGQEMIKNLLDFDVGKNIDNTKALGLKQAWSSIRVIASILLVAIALFMVISQILGAEFLSAYTVKKVVPKLVIAVILMQLSWVILVDLINAFNILGRGIADLILQPFGVPINIEAGAIIQKALTKTTGIVEGGAALGASVLLVLSGPGALVTVGGAFVAAAIAILTGIIVLVVRQILIIALLIFAPIAIVAWILPGTEKFWKMWWSNFSKLLMMYPLIMGMLAMGVAFAEIAANSGTSDSVRFFTIIIAYFAPYFMISKTFKMGGSLMGAVSGAASKFSDRAKKGILESKPMKNLEQAHRENVKAAGYENIKSGSLWRKKYGRLQAGTMGAYGKYNEQLSQRETEADEKNASAELAQIMRGIDPQGMGIDPNAVDPLKIGVPQAGGALKENLGNILRSREGDSAMVNGKNVKVTRRLQQAASLQALTYKYSDLIDDHMNNIKTPTGDSVAETEYRSFIQNHAPEFDAQMPDVVRGTAGIDGKDSKGVLKKGISAFHDLSGQYNDATQQYNGRRGEVVSAIDTLRADPNKAAVAAGHLTNLANNQDLKLGDLQKLSAHFGVDLLKVRQGGGNLAIMADGAGGYRIDSTAQGATRNVSTPPNATATTADGEYYTTHPNPADPAAEWKPTRKG